MLGVQSSRKMVRPPCPFQGDRGRCGAETHLHDDQKTMVECSKGHLTDVAQMPAPAEQIAPPARLRPTFQLPHARTAVLIALVLDAIARHLL
jgi:hypothetical protein